MTMTRLTAVILTLNSAKTLQNCLTPLNGLADEIVIIDGYSTDDTVKIAKKYGSKIIFSKAKAFDRLRNIGIENSSGDWIFMVDSDEIVPDELKNEIKEVLKNPIYEVYYIPRINYCGNKGVVFDLNNFADFHSDLFRNKRGFHYEREIHELLFFDDETVANLPHGHLRNPMIHLNKPFNLRAFFSLRDLIVVAKFDVSKFYRKCTLLRCLELRKIPLSMTIGPLTRVVKCARSRQINSYVNLVFIVSSALKIYVAYNILIFIFKLKRN